MMTIRETLEEALQYLSNTHRNKRFYSILYFEKDKNRVSKYYTFTGEANSVHRLQDITTEWMKEYLVERKVVKDPEYFEEILGAKLLRNFARGIAVGADSMRGGFTPEGRLKGGIELGGHAEEELARHFYYVYGEVQAQAPDSVVILNSHTPCTRADSQPSATRKARWPQAPESAFEFGPSCTEKLNQLSTLVPIPRWTVYCRQPYGALLYKGNSNLELVDKRNAALHQHASIENLTISPFTNELEQIFRGIGVPLF